MSDEIDARRAPTDLDVDMPVRTPAGAYPPEVSAPLAIFEGAEPPAPDWFHKALARTPERSFVKSGGVDIELLTWGEVGKPGLLFIHGGTAHADWWSFIAPFLADDYRVAAMSLAGMGGSGWRETYDHSDYAADAEVCARAAGLYEGGRKPIYIGHSFGGAVTYYAAVNLPHQMHAAVLLDTAFRTPPSTAQKLKTQLGEGVDMRAIPSLDKPLRVYPTLAAALARFRLMPPQGAKNLYVLDHIARGSLKPAPMPGGGEGWTWRFDPFLWDKLDRRHVPGMQAHAAAPTIPMVHICGENSAIMKIPKSPLLQRLTTMVIPDSEHHLMVDQPLALVTALRSVLAVWPS